MKFLVQLPVTVHASSVEIVGDTAYFTAYALDPHGRLIVGPTNDPNGGGYWRGLTQDAANRKAAAGARAWAKRMRSY
jgi:hypothetical protein